MTTARRLALDVFLANRMIGRAFAGAAQARAELAACPCRTMPYLDHYSPELHVRNDHP